MRGLGAVLATLGVLFLSPAWAGECAPDRVVAAYAEAQAAQAQGRAEQAEATWRALAAEGFAPAQRHLGEMLRQRSDSKAEAYWWLLLALQRGDRLARDPMSALGSEISMGARVSDRRRVEEWVPTSSACTRAFLDRLGKGQPSVRAFTASFSVEGNMGRPHDQVTVEAGHYLASLVREQPDLVPYLTALPAIRVENLPTVAAVDHGLDDQCPALVLDGGVLAPGGDRNRPAVTAAIRDAVHRCVDPPPVLKVEYRGRQLFLRSYDQNDTNLDLLRQALDLAEKLPPDLRALAAVPQRVVVEPLRPGEVRYAVALLMVSGEVRFSRVRGGTELADVVAGLVGAGAVLDGRRKGQDIIRVEAEQVAKRAREYLLKPASP